MIICDSCGKDVRSPCNRHYYISNNPDRWDFCSIKCMLKEMKKEMKHDLWERKR